MMQLITMEVGYGSTKAIKALTDPQYAELRERFRDDKLTLDRSEISDWASFDWVGTIDDLQFLSDLGIKASVSRVRGMYCDALPKLGVPQPDAGATQIVNLVIPNAALFSVRRLSVIENECTNYIQQQLDKGWRIVAVCPPNDTRRPTYILGHMEMES